MGNDGKLLAGSARYRLIFQNVKRFDQDERDHLLVAVHEVLSGPERILL